MAVPKKSGGAKKKSTGRKKSADPKMNVQFYAEKSLISAVGGMEAARTISYEALKARKELIEANK